MADLIISAIQSHALGSQKATAGADATSSLDLVTLRQIQAGPNGYGPMVVVGSSLNATKGQYTCDGTADDVEIQQAIAFAVSNNILWVKLLPGTYNITATIDIPSKIGVIGSGTGSRGTLVKTNSLNITAFQMLGATGSANYDFDPILADMEVRGSNDATKTSNYGLLVKWCDRYTVRNVYFRQCYYGVIVIDGTNGLIENNYIKQSMVHAIRFNSLDADGSCHSNKFVKNTIDTTSNAGQGVYIFRGASNYTVNYNTFENNKVIDTIEAAFRNEGSDNSFIDNVIVSPGRHGIRFSSDGLRGDHNRAVGNEIVGAVMNGVYIDDANGTARGNIIEGNTIKQSHEHNIVLEGSIDTKVIGNDVSDASFSNGAGNYDGICLNSSTYNVVRPIITGNSMYDTRAGGSRTQDRGLEVLGTGVSNAIIANNRAFNNVTENIDSTAVRYSDIFLQPEVAYQKMPISTLNTSNPPTTAELAAAFGTAAEVGAGFRTVIDDNAGHTNEYIVWSDGTNYFYVAGTIAP